MRKSSLFIAVGALIAATLVVSVRSGIAQHVVLAPFVQLQSATPGTQQAGNINVSGTTIAATFKGSGSGLTGVPWGSLTGVPGTLLTLPYAGSSGTSGAAFTVSDTNPAGIGIVGAIPHNGTYSFLSNSGVNGYSDSGTGAIGITSSGNGVQGYGSTVGTGVNGTSNTGVGVYGVQTSTGNYGILGDSRRGVYARGVNVDGIFVETEAYAGSAIAAHNDAALSNAYLCERNLSGDFFGEFHISGDEYIYDTASRPMVGLGNGSIAGNNMATPGLVDTYAIGTSTSPITSLNYILNGGNATNQGVVGVYYNGVGYAGMWVNADLQSGTITATIKNFREPNPYQANTDITYACVEGPEAAMYVRGTGHLVGGRATISLPKHFTVLAILQGMTVQLTPLSPSSEGLCVTRKNLVEGVDVAELRNGTGTYDFDWEVKAVRSRYKDYKVIRPSMRMMKGGGVGDVIPEREVRQLDEVAQPERP